MTHATPREACHLPKATARAHPEDARAQLHSELTEIVRSEIGMNEHFASDHAAAILRGLCTLHGGSALYIPAEDKSARNAAIRAEFNGQNADALMRKHGVSRTTLYRIAGER